MGRKSNLQKNADIKQENLYKHFPTSHWLSNKDNVLHMMAWCTFWRRNLHRFARDYLQIKMYPYQELTLYELGVSNKVCIIASRNAAKTFMIALYSCCMAILYPGIQIVIGSATMKQSKIIITEKIQKELYHWSPNLKKEIKTIYSSVHTAAVHFHNGSTITAIPVNENARGLRSNIAVREEFRLIKKSLEDEVLSPFQTPRRPPYLLDPFYSSIAELYEEPVDIYISSSYIDNGSNWMWEIVDNSKKDFVKEGSKTVLLAFDESIVLKHKLKLPSQLIKEKQKQDPTSWKTEFLNLRVKESISSYFTYAMLSKAQTLEHVFYPRKNSDYRLNKKNKYAIPKQDNEIRIVSNDLAFISGSKNDNSVYCCVRAIPETTTYDGGNGEVELEQGYRRQYVYIESNQYGDTTKQALRIRQLYEDFNADYIVLDARNGGIQVIYTLQKVLYDKERGVEYPPLKCMNNDKYAQACSDPDARECIFAVNAGLNMNSDIAVSFRQKLLTGKIDFLVPFNTALDEILSDDPEYVNADPEEQVDFYERPFLETQAMVSECADLQYEKVPGSSAVRIYERGTNRKDRYTAASYGSYFIDWLEIENRITQDDYNFVTLIN